MRRGRNRLIVRAVALLQRLDCRVGITLKELAEDMGVSTRTIRRDLEALEEAGISIVNMDDEGELAYPRRWRIFKRREAA